jgi:hypothetical protein
MDAMIAATRAPRCPDCRCPLPAPSGEATGLTAICCPHCRYVAMIRVAAALPDHLSALMHPGVWLPRRSARH